MIVGVLPLLLAVVVVVVVVVVAWFVLVAVSMVLYDIIMRMYLILHADGSEAGISLEEEYGMAVGVA